MTIWLLFALIPAFFLGRIAVRGGDLGSAVLLCAAAGCLTSVSLRAASTPTVFGGLLFLLVLGGTLLHTERTPVSTPWRQHWRERLRFLQGDALLLAVFCGLSMHYAPLLSLLPVLGLLTQLAKASPRHSAAIVLATVGATLLGLCASSWLSTDITTLICSAAGISIAGLHILSVAESFTSTRTVRGLFCLFVFLTYYYTNCII